MPIKKYIPNILTSLNLTCGCISVVFAFNGLLHIAAILVLIAALFDFLDGFSARLLHAYSAIGKELDSLADLISFGFAPSVVIYSYLQQLQPDWAPELWGLNIIPFGAFIITIFSALRLAIFNVDERQSDQFIGLPTPANAILIVSLPLILQYGSEQNILYSHFVTITTNVYVMLGLSLLTSFLLVSHLPLFSLKFKNYQFNANRIRYIFILISGVLLIFLGVFALPLIISLYIILSVIALFIKSKRV